MSLVTVGLGVIWVAVVAFVVWLWTSRHARYEKDPRHRSQPAMGPNPTMLIGPETLRIEKVELTDKVIRLHAKGVSHNAYAPGEEIGVVVLLGDDGLPIAEYPAEFAPTLVGVGDTFHMLYDVSLVGSEREFERWVLAP